MALRPISIVLTASGCPGAATLIRMLKTNGEREVTVHAVDARPDAIGRFLADSFAVVPWGTDDRYVEALAAEVERRRPDVLFVQSSLEVGPVSRHKQDLETLGTKVLVGEPGGIDACNDKAAMHAALLHTPVRQPDIAVPRDLHELVSAAHRLGYPERPVCFKPPVAKGSRGFRVLRPDVDRVHRLLHERPSEVTMTLDELVGLFQGCVDFPRVMLMEYVEGIEHTVDALVEDGRILLYQAKTREAIATGLAMAFRTVERPDLVEAAAHVCQALQLDWFANIQFKGDRLLEVNPRVSTFVYQEDFNLPYLGIKRALGELADDDLPELQARVRTTRRTVRYYDQVFWDEAGDGWCDPGAAGTSLGPTPA